MVEHGPAPTDGRASYAVATACPTQTATEHSSEARRFQIMRRQGVHFSMPLHTQCGTDKHFEWSRRSGLGTDQGRNCQLTESWGFLSKTLNTVEMHSLLIDLK